MTEIVWQRVPGSRACNSKRPTAENGATMSWYDELMATCWAEPLATDRIGVPTLRGAAQSLNTARHVCVFLSTPRQIYIHVIRQPVIHFASNVELVSPQAFEWTACRYRGHMLFNTIWMNYTVLASYFAFYNLMHLFTFSFQCYTYVWYLLLNTSCLLILYSAAYILYCSTFWVFCCVCSAFSLFLPRLSREYVFHQARSPSAGMHWSAFPVAKPVKL